MRLGIMQPYFLPYIGYFQLIQAVDTFVLYDNIKYTKKGWINRNRLLREGKDAVFSLPLRSASDQLNICDREVSRDFNRAKLLNQFNEAYRRAPYYAHTIPLLERLVCHEESNLYHYLYHSIKNVCEHLNIATEIRTSSTICIDHSLKSHAKVLAFCDAMNATTYINSAGGIKLYERESFRERGVDLRFIRALPYEYRQFGGDFVPWLSIIDILMFNSIDTIQTQILPCYQLE